MFLYGINVWHFLSFQKYSHFYPVYLVYLDTSIKTLTKREAAPAIAPCRHLALTKGELAPTALSAGAAGPGAEGVYPARYSVLPDTGLIGTQGGHEPLDRQSA